MKRTLAGYEIEHRLGEGSSGSVWRARRIDALEQPVAIKRLRPGPDARERLRREAAALAALDHPHIVRILDLVDHDDELAIVMQLATGGSLEERLARRGRISVDDGLRILADVGAALSSAHRRGIVHGDVKPANVLFTSDGEVLLADFGLAGERIEGTPGFVAPEVLAGEPPGVPADVYGLAALAARVLGDEPSEETRAAVARGMAADPSDRFASVDEFVRALRGEAQAVDRSPETEPAVEPVVTPSEPTRDFGPRPPRPGAPAPAGPPRWPLAAAAVLIAAVLVLIVAAARTGTDPATAAAPTAPSCSPPGEIPGASGDRLDADLDGDGCPDPVVRSGNVLVRLGPSGAPERYALGRAGDLAVVGDWDCDGTATPGLHRAATGEAFLFDGWARPGEELPASTVVAAPSPPRPQCQR